MSRQTFLGVERGALPAERFTHGPIGMGNAAKHFLIQRLECSIRGEKAKAALGGDDAATSPAYEYGYPYPAYGYGAYPAPGSGYDEPWPAYYPQLVYYAPR